MTRSVLPPNPFPGLRPFRGDEEALFFGRETQVDAMVDKLAATRFLAIVGTSGSGKSSLVNCGLVPALHRGLMAGAGSMWRVATLRPGNRPLRALAEALAQPGVLGMPVDEDAGFTPAEMTEATLRMGKLGLVDAVEQAHLGPQQNLLVVVDQFEELFRYQSLSASAAALAPASGAAGEDAVAFVNLLLEVAEHPALRVCVVLTMRSDFLGECAQFFGLPEAINRGQYLVPRMTRDERRSAIAGPVGASGAAIDPVLLTRLVNDVGDNPDQLSILQHALNRTWARWEQQGRSGALALPHYEAVGTMAHALNQHAEEAFGELGEGRPRALAEALFKSITDKVTDARGTRRPTRLDTLCAITGSSVAELRAVIDVLRDPARSFLMPPAGTPLQPDTPIDISHESLMRVWERLRTWGDEEARSAQTFRRLAEGAELERAGEAALLRQPDLQFALDWLQRRQPNAAWAARYRGGFDAMLDFLQRSQSAYDAELRAEAAQHEQQAQLQQRQRRWRNVLFVMLPVFVLLLGVSATALYYWRDAVAARTRAEAAEVDAKREAAVAKEALAQARAAQSEAAAVQRQLTVAERSAPELRAAVEQAQQAQQAVQNKSLVYLQYADAGQKEMMTRLAAQLGKAGYAAPGSERVSAVPSRMELRYFRRDDAAAVAALAELLKRWNFGSLRPVLVEGYGAQVKQRQFEIWLARPDAAEIDRLLTQLDAPGADERKAAGQQLQDRYTASPAAIAAALALLRPERVDALSVNGRINLLYFLTRSAPLAWDPAWAAAARETAERVLARGNAGEQTKTELERLLRLLDAVSAGQAAVPG